YQLMITALRRREIVIGKMLPYLVVSSVLIVIIILLSRWHFGVTFHDLPALALVCLLFLLCSLGLGLLISAFSRTQTQAIEFSVLSFGFGGGIRLVGSICAARTVASGRSLHLRAISVDTFLPRFSTGEHVPRGSGVLY